MRTRKYKEGNHLCEIGVFSGCSNLRVVELPKSLETIGRCCFNYCESLVQVNIPSGVIELGERAFCHCYCLESISLPQGIQHLPRQVFHRCNALASIKLPLSIKAIGDGAFDGCSSLASINFHELKELESIGYNAFSYCSALVEVDLSELPKLKDIDWLAFGGCSSLTNFSFPPNIEITEKWFNYWFKYSPMNVTLPATLISLYTGLLRCKTSELPKDVLHIILPFAYGPNFSNVIICNVNRQAGFC